MTSRWLETAVTLLRCIVRPPGSHTDTGPSPDEWQGPADPRGKWYPPAPTGHVAPWEPPPPRADGLTLDAAALAAVSDMQAGETVAALAERWNVNSYRIRNARIVLEYAPDLTPRVESGELPLAFVTEVGRFRRDEHADLAADAETVLELAELGAMSCELRQLRHTASERQKTARQHLTGPAA